MSDLPIHVMPEEDFDVSLVSDYNIGKVNQAINDSERLERVNEILSNDDIEGMPESSRMVMETAMESIRESLIGRGSRSNVSLEGFKDKASLQLAIEENKSIIGSVWDAIVKFFSSIFEFIGKFFGISKKKTESNSSNVSSIKRVATYQPLKIEKSKAEIEFAKTQKDFDRIGQDLTKREEELKKKEAELAAIPVKSVKVKEDESSTLPVELETPKDKDAAIRKLEFLIQELDKAISDTKWYAILETSEFNKLLNPKFVKDEIISVKLDDEIKILYQLTDYFHGKLKHELEIINKNLDRLDSRLDLDTTNNAAAAISKKMAMSDIGDNNERLNGIQTAIKYIVDSSDKTVFGYRFEKAEHDSQVHLYEIHERKNRSILVDINYKDLEGITNDLIKLSDMLHNFKIKIPSIQKKIEALKPEDSSISEADIANSQNALRQLLKTINENISTIVKVIDQGNNNVRIFSMIIKQVLKEKTDKEVKAFKALKELYEVKRKELNDLKST